MRLTVGDLLDLVVDLTQRAYGTAHGVVDHCCESTGEWSTEVLEALGVVVPLLGSRNRFEVRPRTEWPVLVATVKIGALMETRGPVGDVVVSIEEVEQ